MTVEKILRLKSHIEVLTSYLASYRELINCHMVNYLKDNHWEALIPQDIQNEIQTESDIEEAITCFWNHSSGEEVANQKFTSLQNFMKINQTLTLENLNPCMHVSTSELCAELDKLGCNNNVDYTKNLNIKEFMNAKKNHEVEITAAVIAKLCRFKSKDAEDMLDVIDAGDGKGYLSSRLALEHKLRVLGVDGNLSNTQSAAKRNQKLGKAWNGLTKRAEDVKNGLIPPRRGKKKANTTEDLISEAILELNVEETRYKTTTQMIDSSTDLVELVRQQFEDSSNRFCLSGLHTCGNLSPNSLNIFRNNESVEVVCNVGCCYHLLVEQFIEDEFFNSEKLEENSKDFGFPISQYLKLKEFSLGRNARMLASQSIHRVKANRELPNDILIYRALFELIMRQHSIESSGNTSHSKSVQVGKIKCNNFVDYVEKCIKKLNIKLNKESLPDLEKFYRQHQFDCKLLKLFYLIRLSFAGIIETIIILDKYLYLLEHEVENAFIVKLFDPVLSPRCFGIVALKLKTSGNKI